MGLEEDEAKRQLKMQTLKDAKISERFFSRPLSKAGHEGKVLREYMKGEMKEARQINRGLVYVSESTNIAQAFARDMAIVGTGIRFAYMQTFANYMTNEEFAFKGFVIEWFEQLGQPSPFTPKERFSIETEILRMIDAGRIFYIFTQVPPTSSTWWSKSFWDTVLDTNDIMVGGKNDNRKNNKRTSIGDTEGEGRKGSKPNQRVTVR